MLRNRIHAIFSELIQLLALMFFAVNSNAETIHEERSKYRDITVTQVGERRCLLFNVHRGDRNQTCMMLDDPNRLVFDYTRMSFAGLLLQQAPQSILVIGLGGGSIPMTFADLFPSAQIDVIEIDDAVVKVAKEYFQFQSLSGAQIALFNEIASGAQLSDLFSVKERRSTRARKKTSGARERRSLSAARSCFGVNIS